MEKQSQELIDELDKLRREKERSDFTDKAIDARRKQKSAVNKMFLEANPVTEKHDDYVLPRALKKGDRVILADSGRRGVVFSEPDSKGICFVQMGAMKTKVDVKRLRLDESKPAEQNGGKKKKERRGIHTRSREQGYEKDKPRAGHTRIHLRRGHLRIGQLYRPGGALGRIGSDGDTRHRHGSAEKRGARTSETPPER